MRMPSTDMKIRMATGAALLAALLAGCEKPLPPAEAPAPDVPAPQTTAPPTEPTAAPAEVPAVPATGAAATAPAGLAAAAANAVTSAPAASEPPIAAMTAAAPPAKLGVPVDLRYQFDGDPQSGQWVTLHLAAVPRTEGSNLKVSIKDDPRVRVAKTGDITASKASASTAYRQQLSVAKLAGGPSELRVLVTMEVGEASAFSWFSVPFSAPVAAQKQKPVEQH